jgi:hypothetical protein
MHQPGYIQEGQEVIFGYLLLGIYHRRIPGETGTFNRCKSNVRSEWKHGVKKYS